MEKTKKQQSILTGYIGECYVALELAKRKIVVQKMDNSVVSYDFTTSNGVKIEVKSSRPTSCLNGQKTGRWNCWIWNNIKHIYSYVKNTQIMDTVPIDRKCDFYVFVGMNKNWKPKKFFIVPANLLGKRKVISEPINRKYKNKGAKYYLGDYENKWDLILNHSKL